MKGRSYSIIDVHYWPLCEFGLFAVTDTKPRYQNDNVKDNNDYIDIC